MATHKVVVTDHVFPSLEIERSLLGTIGAELQILQAASDEELLGAVIDADALLVCYASITARLISRMQRCRIIARYGIGVDNVDLGAASGKGIVVTNVPDYCLDEVSDHALALVMACARKIVFLNSRVRDGRWEGREAAPIHRLRGQVLGLVGFGKIARILSEKARVLGFLSIASDPYVDETIMASHGVRKVDLTDLLAEADFVSIHAPLTGSTQGLIGEAELRRMKRSAYLVNTARGALVQESALVRALREGWIGGAALDVLEMEPLDRQHPLLKLGNVILTPHVAFYSEESVRELQRKAAEEVVNVLSNKPPRYRVTATI